MRSFSCSLIAKLVYGLRDTSRIKMKMSGLTVDIDRTQDDFIKNLLTIRVERRLGLAVLDAGAIGGGDWEYQ